MPSRAVVPAPVTTLAVERVAPAPPVPRPPSPVAVPVAPRLAEPERAASPDPSAVAVGDEMDELPPIEAEPVPPIEDVESIDPLPLAASGSAQPASQL